MLNNPALLLSAVAIAGWTGSYTFSRMACERSYSGSASPYFPWNAVDSVAG